MLWGNPAAREYVKAAAKSGAEVIVASGLPTDLPKYCTDKNIALIPVVSSRRGAAAIVRNWTQKYNRIPDAFILQGPFAAGLLGFKEEQLDRAEQEWGRIISDVKSEASKLENCPLLVGGGIYRREDAEFVYKCSDFYHPNDEGGLIWNDPDIGVEWPIPEGMELSFSDKDTKWGSFKEYRK